MKFKMRTGRIKLLLLSCDRGISLKLSALTSGYFDVESSNTAHNIIQDDIYKKYRFIIFDVDNDPDGAYNVVSYASSTPSSKNVTFIGFTSDIESDDVLSLMEINPNITFVQKPVSAVEIYSKVKTITEKRNTKHAPKIKKVKSAENLNLLKDSETNLFSKQSFLDKLDRFLPTNKRKHMHVMLIGIDNFEIYSAIYSEEKANDLISFVSSHLSSPIIMYAGRFSSNKVLLLVNGDEITCENLLNELRLYVEGYKTKFPLILHGGICEILPEEGEARILVNHAHTAYIYAKYAECDNIIIYEQNLKYLIWNGENSIYNTSIADMDKSDEPWDWAKSDEALMDTKEFDIVKDLKPFENNIEKTKTKEEIKDIEHSDFLSSKYDFKETNIEELPFFDDDIDQSLNIDTFEDKKEVEDSNKPFEYQQLSLNDSLNDEEEYTAQPFDAPAYSLNDLQDKEDLDKDIRYEKSSNIPETSFVTQKKDEQITSTFNSKKFEPVFDLEEKEEIKNEPTYNKDNKEKEEAPVIENVLHEEIKEEPKSKGNEDFTNKSFYDKDEFFKACNTVLKKTQNHNPLFMIEAFSDFSDDLSYPDYEEKAVRDVFGENAYICKHESSKYYVFFDEDFDETKSKKYAEKLIEKFTGTRYGNIICKIGIGIASTISSDIKNSLFYAQFAYKSLKSGKEESSYKCFKSMNK